MFRRVILAAFAATIIGCASPVEIFDFVGGLERTLEKIKVITPAQILSQDPNAERHVRDYIQQRQCRQDVGDAIVMFGAGIPIDFEARAAPDAKVGISLLQPPAFSFGGGGGSTTKYRIIPTPISRIAQKNFEINVEIASKIKDLPEAKELITNAWAEKKSLETRLGELISAYPEKVDCKRFPEVVAGWTHAN